MRHHPIFPEDDEMTAALEKAEAAAEASLKMLRLAKLEAGGDLAAIEGLQTAAEAAQIALVRIRAIVGQAKAGIVAAKADGCDGAGLAKALRPVPGDALARCLQKACKATNGAVGWR
jgi:hypothetical protein